MNRFLQQAPPRISFAMASLAILAIAFPFAVIPAQAQTVTAVYNFGISGDPRFPAGTMAQGRDGAFYGTTIGGPIGGNWDFGVVYKITSSGVVTVLHILTTAEGTGCNGLTIGTDGNFYGSCFSDDTNAGTLIKVKSTGALTVLHRFAAQSAPTDGCLPAGSPVQGGDGNFYGTTLRCGTFNDGVAYKITPAGVYTVLHNFAYTSTDPGVPYGALIQGSDGNFWGTSSGGGTNNIGSVFKMTSAGKVTIVHSFTGPPDGSGPQSGLIQGSDGNYYGTTMDGGANLGGTIFGLTPGGVETILHAFPNVATMGSAPMLSLTQGPDGLLYGIATHCVTGVCGQAEIFSMTTAGAYSTLYPFPMPGIYNDNSLPLSPLLLSTDGTFYGTEQLGGPSTDGNVYSLGTTFSPFLRLTLRSGKVGKLNGILGQGFNSLSVVAFGGIPATKITLTGSTFITATVPVSARTGVVTVTTGTTTLASNTSFKVTPAITSFTPASAPAGSSVTISGSGLSQASQVAFGKVAAITFVVNSESQVTATVPATGKTGKITVTTPGGVATSALTFTVN